MGRLGANTAVAGAATIAGVLSVLAVSGYSPTSPAATAAPATTISQEDSSATPGLTPPASTQAPPTPTSSTQPATPTFSPTSPSPTATPSSLIGLPPDEAATVVVIGDGQGDESDEWVRQLGKRMGNSRRTLVHQLDAWGEINYGQTYTEGSQGPQVAIWNASRVATITVDSTNLTEVMPEEPNLVLLSLGRNSDAQAVTRQLRSAFAAIKGSWPDVEIGVVLQPELPGGKNANTLKAVQAFAQEKSLPLVDVKQAFMDSPNEGVRVAQSGAVSTKGQELWAETVNQAINKR